MLQLLLLLPLLFTATMLQSCAPHAPQVADTRGGAEAVAPDTVITLERTTCFGTCPAYKITVYGDGRLVYEGRRYVKTTGTVESTVTQEQLSQLMAEFEKADYFSLLDSYQTAADGCPTNWSDNPNANTSIRLNGRAKSIAHDYGCQEKSDNHAVYPQKLYQLESRIDEIVNSALWVKDEDAEKKKKRR